MCTPLPFFKNYFDPTTPGKIMLSERASHRKILATRGADVYNGAKEKGGRGMGREFELKYRAQGEVLARIREALGDFDPMAMETVYYDTPERTLSAKHWTLRQTSLLVMA